MIGIDTNILLRYLLDDDKVQSAIARTIIKETPKILITDVVLVETVWTLQGKKYNVQRTQILNVIRALFDEPTITFEQPKVAWMALQDFRLDKGRGRKFINFADALIARKARWQIEVNNELCDGVYTFDRAAQTLPDMKDPYRDYS